jgi:hypothetical protein
MPQQEKEEDVVAQNEGAPRLCTEPCDEPDISNGNLLSLLEGETNSSSTVITLSFKEQIQNAIKANRQELIKDVYNANWKVLKFFEVFSE